MQDREHLSMRGIQSFTQSSRNTVPDLLRQLQIVESASACREVVTQLDAYAGTRLTWLTTNRYRSKRERCTVLSMCDE